MDYEQKAEELLKALGKELYKDRIEAFDQLDKEPERKQIDAKNKHKRHVRLTWVAILCIRYPSFLPEGYTKTAEDDFDTVHTLTYENKKTGDVLSITQINDKSFSMSVDTETSQREQCMVKTYEAYYIGGNENHMLMWEEDGVHFEINSMLDQNTLIKIANYLE